ncbi:MAG: 23S rRNA (adenine(2503)-C(2))-methyltransferase RlmN [Clostridia bacterium]|nr:23S rRNA (adenine(2503)-C(2))-methyltransferase RlmN [Clostridia bacterium]
MLESLRNYSLEALETWFQEHNIPKFRAKQVFDWISKGVTAFDEMNNVPADLKNQLKEHFFINNMMISDVMTSSDGTRKYLMTLNDGNIIECVLMRYKHGNSICVSSQVGCKMGCSFCASTLYGLERNLDAGEIIGQVMTVSRDIQERISNIVLMGSGEPLDNYHEVLKFMRLVNHPKGMNIGMRNITLSTCGLIPKIEALMEEKLQITLAVSLHAAEDEVRDALMPVNKSYAIRPLLEVCKRYAEVTGRRVTFEYALIAGKNDQRTEAERLAILLRNIHCHVNLIPINPVVERSFKASDQAQAKQFQNILKQHGIEATIRRELGSDIDAACGQLRNKHINRASK